MMTSKQEEEVVAGDLLQQPRRMTYQEICATPPRWGFNPEDLPVAQCNWLRQIALQLAYTNERKGE